MADTPTGETVAPVAPSNEPGNTPAPQGQQSADVEQAKREAEQAKIRANQLENELKAAREKQAELDRKQLEEKEEYKALYEKTQSQLDELKTAQEQELRQSELVSATDSVFKDFPTNVVEVAKTAGLSLSDDSEAAKNSLVEKLNAIKDKVAPETATSNNASTTTPAPAGEGTRLGQPRTIGVDDGTKNFTEGSGKKFSEYVAGLPQIQEMKRQAGVPTE